MDAKQRIENKQWEVTFYPAYDAPPERYVYLDKDKPLAFQQFSYFLETRNDPDYPKMYKKINLSVIVGNLSCIIDEILFKN